MLNPMFCCHGSYMFLQDFGTETKDFRLDVQVFLLISVGFILQYLKVSKCSCFFVAEDSCPSYQK